jgi:hypothetical protein
MIFYVYENIRIEPSPLLWGEGAGGYSADPIPAQRQFKGRLCERMWMTISNKIVIFQCPQGREKQIVN